MTSLVEGICKKYAAKFTRKQIQMLPRDIWPYLRRYMDVESQIKKMCCRISTCDNGHATMYYGVYAVNTTNEKTDYWPLIQMDGDVKWKQYPNEYNIWDGVSDRIKKKQKRSGNRYLVKLRRYQISHGRVKVMTYESQFVGPIKTNNFVEKCDELFGRGIPRRQTTST